MKFKALLILALGILTSPLSAQPNLAGNEWGIKFVRGTSSVAPTAFIKFDTAGSRFTGNTGCNIMNGGVKMKGSRISFSAVITTKRACTRTTAPTESGLLNALGRVDRFQKYRDHIRLYSGKQLLIELSPRYITPEEPEMRPVADQIPLENRKWVLESIAGSPIPKVDQEAFITFDSVKKSAGGNSSCNVFGGSYEVDGSNLKITETISTMRACIEDKRMDIERDFFDALRKVDRYEVRGIKLHLYQGDKLLLSFVGQKSI